jgi:hypothetical protein
MRTVSILRPLTHCLVAGALVAVAVAAGCNGGAGSAGGASWPNASKLKAQPLPSGITWTGVYFINTMGSRGTMHLFVAEENKIHGCWLAEDKHARATFLGEVNENIAKFDWTEKKVGFTGAPTHITAYLVLTPDPEGRHHVAGEYGEDATNDGGNKWEGIKQKNQEPKEDGCRLEAGDTVPSGENPVAP